MSGQIHPNIFLELKRARKKMMILIILV